MKGIIISNQNQNIQRHKIDRLMNVFNERKIDVDLVINNGNYSLLSKQKVFGDLDFIIYLDKDYYFAKMLEAQGYLLINNADFIRLCDDKALLYIDALDKGIPVIKTVYAPLLFDNECSDDNLKFLDKAIEQLSLPLIMKKGFSSLGDGVKLIHSKQELIDEYKKSFKEPICFQKYIESSIGQSVRIIVIDNKIIGMIKRISLDDFRSNCGENNYSIIIEEIPPSYVKIVNLIIEKYNVLYAGIDLLIDNDEPLLCEINANAFFKEFEKTTGIDVANKFVDMVIKTVKEKEEKNEK